jgi:hypothetical protein
MENDLLTTSFTTNIDKNLLRRNFSIVKTVYFLAILYFMIDIFYWYLNYKDLQFMIREDFKSATILKTEILGIVYIISSMLIMYAYYCNRKAYNCIIAAVETEDPEGFNRGFKVFYTSNVIGLISIFIHLSTLSYNILSARW